MILGLRPKNHLSLVEEKGLKENKMREKEGRGGYNFTNTLGS